MKQRTQYSYVVLRYVHDVMTSEFVNVGIVMYVPEHSRLMSRTRHTIGRLRGVFPDLDRSAFNASMGSTKRGLQRIGKRKSKDGLFRKEGSLLGLIKEALPADDSSLQWSPIGSGITDDPQKTFERLYTQFVTKYDTKAKHRRSDDEIWRPVMAKLDERHLTMHLQEKIISSDLDDVTFKHAWKNGKWHVYEPVSFDLAEGESIKSKAREWLGHLSAVVADGKAESFKAHFLVGAPSDPKLKGAYEAAKKILQHAPNAPEIFEETQVDDLVAQIEDEVRSHSTTAR